MKSISSVILFFLFTANAFAQTLYLPEIRNLEEYEAFKNREEIAGRLERVVYIGNVVWNHIPIKYAYFYEKELRMDLDHTVENNAIQCIDWMKSTYQKQLIKEKDWFDTRYSFENNYYKIGLRIDSEEEKITEDSPGVITITFKTQYTNLLSQINNVLDENPQTGKLYYLHIECSNKSCELFLNSIPIAYHTGKYPYSRDILLNPFIIGGNPQVIGFQITPGDDENGYCEVSVLEKQSDSDVINETKYGAGSLSGSYPFIPDIHYEITGWKNATDLRKETELKSQIIALYQQLADAIQAKDENKFSELLYQTYYETAVSTYNMQEKRTEVLWEENWLPILHHSYRYTIAEDFDLQFSSDGKLVYARPLQQKDMLRVIGKRIAEGFTFFIYKDAVTKQLKFVRQPLEMINKLVILSNQ
jgi:hypothetical protein